MRYNEHTLLLARDKANATLNQDSTFLLWLIVRHIYFCNVADRGRSLILLCAR